jgi:hypothetical protein
MSWDAMLYSKDPGPVSRDMKTPPLGDAQFVREQISKSLPGVNWSDPAWGVLDGNGWSIEFNHQESGSTDSVMLHVRGGGDPISSIVKLCKETGWVAFDLQTGTLVDLTSPSDKSWKEFQGYRDRVGTTVAVPATAAPTILSERSINFAISGVIMAIVIWLLLRR